MENLETPAPSPSTSKKSALSQTGVSLPDLPSECLKEPLMGEKYEFPNKMAIQEKEAPVAPREPASDSKIGQRVLAIRRAESHTHEIASSDFNSLEYEIISTFEMVDLDN